MHGCLDKNHEKAMTNGSDAIGFIERIVKCRILGRNDRTPQENRSIRSKDRLCLGQIKTIMRY
jgi:hypothetical protein